MCVHMCVCTHLSFLWTLLHCYSWFPNFDLKKAGQTQKEQRKLKTKESAGNRHSPHHPLSRLGNPDLPLNRSRKQRRWLAAFLPSSPHSSSASWGKWNFCLICVLFVLSKEVATWLGLIESTKKGLRNTRKPELVEGDQAHSGLLLPFLPLWPGHVSQEDLFSMESSLGNAMWNL